jgi:sarcosine oxidase
MAYSAQMAPVHDVAIVGAGLLGLAAARALAAQGRDVVVVEQATIGHDGAGSKGSCRIFRLGYREPDYVTAAVRARDLWRELEAQTGSVILHPAPHLTFGPHLPEVRDAMRRAGAPYEPLSAAAAAERFPGIRLDGPVLLETESAVIAADVALAALAACVPEVRTGVRVTEVADDGRQVTLRTAGPDGTTGDDVTARVAVLTAGPGTAGLLRNTLTGMLRPTLEQVAYFEPVSPAQGASDAGMPIFICHGGQSPYGLPVPRSGRYKIGIHTSGPVVSPDEQDQSPDPALTARLSEMASRYLPGFRPEPVATERCVYDNTPDEDFIVDRIGNVVLGCGTSGHGFKFGPLLGTWLAALAGGGSETPPGRFGLARLRMVPGPG